MNKPALIQKSKPQPPTDDQRTVKIIDDFQVKMHALSLLAVSQLKHAGENQEQELNRLVGVMMVDTKTLQKPDLNARERAHALNAIIDNVRKVNDLRRFSHETLLSETIFASTFSAFDAYVKHLLRNLYARSPRLLLSFGGRTVQFSDVLAHSKEDIANALIETDIDALGRDSYSDLFDKLAKRFEVSTLTNFANWTVFIECSQRRNLTTHCDGLVTQQYLDVCKNAKVSLPPGVQPGTHLEVSRDYLLTAIDVVEEVGVKLGQMLWRISCEESSDAIDNADAHLGDSMFRLLKLEKWPLTIRLGEFGDVLAKRKTRQPRKERSLRIIIINHAQAAKWSGDKATSMTILDAVDWSGSVPEFRLAVASLREEWDNATALMKEVGGKSELFPPHGYVGWPVFREFRATPQFSEAFRSIFGVSFEEEVRSPATKPWREMDMPVDPDLK